MIVMLQLFGAIDKAYEERKENLTPEIEQLKTQQKWSLDRDYHDLKDQIEKKAKCNQRPRKERKF